MKNSEIISSKDIVKHFRISSLIGKKVISEKGQNLGKIKDIAYYGEKILGIFISKRFSLKKILIDKSYIQNIQSDTIILTLNPVTSLIGKTVFDKDGKKIGKVKKVIRTNNNNDFKEILVKKHIFSMSLILPKSKIDVMDKNIILNQVI